MTLCPDHNHGPYEPKHGAHPCTRCFDDALASIARLERLISDDAFAITFQTLGQYRSALLKALRG